MIYDPLYAGWYYSHIDILNFEEIRLELVKLNASKIQSYQTNADYYNLSAARIREYGCPKLFSYLDSVGLSQKFQRILFSTNINRTNVVHVDGFNPVTRCHFSLNLPIIDCEDSYTAFYHYPGKDLHYNPSTYNHYAYMGMDKVTELARVEVSKPVLVNTTILHRGICKTPTRTIAALRFTSPLTVDDMRRLGIKNPLVQEDV